MIGYVLRHKDSFYLYKNGACTTLKILDIMLDNDLWDNIYTNISEINLNKLGVTINEVELIMIEHKNGMKIYTNMGNMLRIRKKDKL